MTPIAPQQISDRAAPDNPESRKNDLIQLAQLGERLAPHYVINFDDRDTFAEVMNIVRTRGQFAPRRVAAAIGDLFDQAAEVIFASGTRTDPEIIVRVPLDAASQIGVTPGDRDHNYSVAERQDFTWRVIAWARAAGAATVSVEQLAFGTTCAVNEPGTDPFQVYATWDGGLDDEHN